MTFCYQASTNSFYAADQEGIPDDAIALTDDEYATLAAALEAGQRIAVDSATGRPVVVARVIYYSASTRGFYDNYLHDSIPADAIEITDDEHRSLLTEQSAGKQITADDGGRPVARERVETSEQAQARLTAAIQRHLDAQAQALGYDDIKSAVTYADEPSVPKFQSEGQALRAWRSMVWEAGYAMLDDCTAGTRSIPTADALLAELPAYVPPTET
jgi:hypothetical protein